jgi:hypothetical protein
VIRGDHRVEFAAHGPDENSISGKRSLNRRFARSRRQDLQVLIAKSAAVSRVRVERAQRDSGLHDTEPLLQSIARDARRLDYRFCAQLFGDASESDMGRRQNDAKLIRSQHHRDARTGEGPEHFGVAGIVVSTGVESRLVDRGGHDSFDHSRARHLDCSLDREASELSGCCGTRSSCPAADRLGDRRSSSIGANDYNVTTLADLRVGERFGDDLWTNPAGVTHGHGKTSSHGLHPE